jgi:PHD/YefM family antitoxin component YafN of YafNO toxin-antitoxin module
LERSCGAWNNETVTVERGGQPKAVILSVEEYERLIRHAPQEEDWQTLLMESRKSFRESLGDKELDIDSVIATMREERSDELFENLR